MSIASKRATLVVAAGLWFAASAMAVSLAYELNRPLHEAGSSGIGLPPIGVAFLAIGWFALVSIVLGWGRQVVHGSKLLYAEVRHHS